MTGSKESASERRSSEAARRLCCPDFSTNVAPSRTVGDLDRLLDIASALTREQAAMIDLAARGSSAGEWYQAHFQALAQFRRGMADRGGVQEKSADVAGDRMAALVRHSAHGHATELPWSTAKLILRDAARTFSILGVPSPSQPHYLFLKPLVDAQLWDVGSRDSSFFA